MVERVENYKTRTANASSVTGVGIGLKEGKAATMGTSLSWIQEMVSKKCQERVLVYVEMGLHDAALSGSQGASDRCRCRRKIIEVACTRAPATAQPKGSVWKELLTGGRQGPAECPPAGTWVPFSQGSG